MTWPYAYNHHMILVLFCLPVTDQLSLNMALSGSTRRFDGSDKLADLGAGFRYTPGNWKIFLAGMAYKSFTDLYDWGLNFAVGHEF